MINLNQLQNSPKLQNLKNRIFPTIIALSALSVSASAAFYSVSGLSKLFAGASLAVVIMASSLEVAKLVIASLLYQYRKTLPLSLKIYLTLAAAVLVLITSMGIYGFLSAAYQNTANKDKFITQQVEVLETKKKLYENTRDNILKEKQSLAELKGTLSKGSTTQFTDRKGNLVVRSNNATVKQIESANKSDENLTSKLDIVNDSIFSLETQILEVKTGGDTASELGPLKYLSGLTGVEMDRIINWLLLIIIFVFDPLAIALVIAANYAFEQLKSKTKENIYGETVPVEETVEGMRKVVEAYNDLEDEIKEWEEASLVDLQDSIEWDKYGNPSPIIEEDDLEDVENKFKQEKINEVKNQESTSGWRKRKQVKELEEQDPFDIYKKQFDSNNDGTLDPEELARFNYWKMLQDRKNNNNEKQITY